MTQAAGPPVPAPAARPSPQEIEGYKRAFAEDGYLVLRNVVSKDGLSQLRTRILDEFERARGTLFQGGGGLMAGHLNSFPGEGARFIYETLIDRGIMDVVKAVFPKVVRGPNVGCNLNLPGSVVQHYHADSNYFTEDFVIVNVAVVDTDLVNGAIDVLPGTQKKFYPFWRFALERASRRTTRLPMQQGDILIRTSNLWHRGMPNRTNVPRPMVALTWEAGGSQLEDPFKRDAGKITFHANWYRPNFVGRLRERTYIAAPFTYDAYRFVRSLAGNKGYSR
ncbi:MAG TPA: phytanoyl-CoA dioxygenase family protein [Polyangiaceae bacterium]|nr:phytanoyl-CoA dioxygenase family protein [Polyangiaceae bacterium]